MVDYSKYSRGDEEESDPRGKLFATVLGGLAIAAIVMIVILPGQTHESIEGEKITYTYTWLRPALIGLLTGSITVLGFGILVEEIGRQYTPGILIGGAMGLGGAAASVVFPPAALQNYLTISGTQLEMDDRGVTFNPRKRSIDLANVGRIERIEERKSRRKTDRFVVFHGRDGSAVQWPENSLLTAAIPKIEEKVQLWQGEVKAALAEAAPAQPPGDPAAVASTNPNEPPAQAPVVDSATGGTATEPSQPRPDAAENPLQAGAIVEIYWGDKWWPGNVIAAVSKDEVKIHYDGWTSDEVVPNSRVREPQKSPPTPAIVAADDQPQPAPAAVAADDKPTPAPAAVATDGKLKPSMAIEAQWGSKWWPAKVVQIVPDGQVKVHYEGWSENFDEVVPTTRVRVLPGSNNAVAQQSDAEDASTKMRTWTDRTGKKLEAELVEVVGAKVRLRKADKKVVTVPLARLSVEDQQFVRESGAIK